MTAFQANKRDPIDGEIAYIMLSSLPPPTIFFFFSSSSNSSTHHTANTTSQQFTQLSNHKPPTIKMETIKNAGNYVADKVQGTSATASKEANKNVAKDSHVAAGDR